MNAVETMGDHVKISLEKVFMCSGKDGYIPTYDPQNGQYGCLSKSENLEYQVKVIVSIQMQLIFIVPVPCRFNRGEQVHILLFFQDRLAPFTVDRDLNGVPLTAKLAEDEGALTLIKQPGADGFVIDTEPLFKVRIVQLYTCN